jgi:serine/threonine protein kinase
MRLGKHPNIVSVRSVDYFNGRLVLALEFITPNELGVNTLEKQLEVKKLDLHETLKWALDVCEGMSFANSKGLIAHRDLKPSNRRASWP